MSKSPNYIENPITGKIYTLSHKLGHFDFYWWVTVFWSQKSNKNIFGKMELGDFDIGVKWFW